VLIVAIVSISAVLKARYGASTAAAQARTTTSPTAPTSR
jgi:hypothetical protein